MKVQYETQPDPGLTPIRVIPYQTSWWGRTYPNHWHESIELVYNIDANLTYWVDGERCPIPENSLFLVNSYSPHQLEAVTRGTYTICVLDYEFIKRWTADEYYNQYLFQLVASADANQHTKVVRSIVNQLTVLESASSTLSQLKKMNLSMALLSQLCEFFTVPISHSIAHDINISMVTYIKQHIREPLSLADLAQHFSYNYSYLSRYFNRVMGHSFTEYVAALRVDLSILQLLGSKDSVQTVALDSGFSSARSYLRAFQRQYHCSPSEFRHRHNGHPEKPVHSYLL